MEFPPGTTINLYPPSSAFVIALSWSESAVVYPMPSVLRTACTAETSAEVPVPLKRRTGSDAGMAGGSAAVAALAGSLRDPHPLNMVAAMIKAATQLNRPARAMRGIQEYTQNPSKWRYYGTASMRNRTSEMRAS